MNDSICLDEIREQAIRRTTRARQTGANEELHFEGLAVLAEEIAAEESADARALRLARQRLALWAEGYFRFVQDVQAFQELLRGRPVRNPLFITGFGRTGSTLLHNLLSFADGAHAPKLWQLWMPSPPPTANDRHDARIGRTRAALATLRQDAPSADKIHPMDAEGPGECHWILRHGPPTAMHYCARRYWDWLRGLERHQLRRLYEDYRQQVQLLLLGQGPRYWVGKSLIHLHYLPVLADVFPDARVIRLHRHPRKIVPSLCSLIQARHAGGAIRPSRLGELVLDVFEDGMARMIETDSDAHDVSVIDIFFSDLVSDPMGVVRRIQHQFGLQHSRDADVKIARYIALQAAERPFRHAYELEDFGLTEAIVMRRAEPYLHWVQRKSGERLADA